MQNFEEWKQKIPLLEKILGHVYTHKEHLETACTHSSYTNEHKDGSLAYNERLEFLGDSVFNLVITEYLYTALPDIQEGQLSQLRASLVSAKSCRNFAEKLQLLPFLLVGRGELLNREKVKTSILADFFEALLGSLYLDAGIEPVKRFVFKNFLKEINDCVQQPQSNWKAELQELVQKTKKDIPHYIVLQESGPDHNKHFEIGVYVDKVLLGQGSGSSKKEAEQRAAFIALQSLLREKS